MPPFHSPCSYKPKYLPQIIDEFFWLHIYIVLEPVQYGMKKGICKKDIEEIPLRPPAENILGKIDDKRTKCIDHIIMKGILPLYLQSLKVKIPV